MIVVTADHYSYPGLAPQKKPASTTCGMRANEGHFRGMRSNTPSCLAPLSGSLERLT